MRKWINLITEAIHGLPEDSEDDPTRPSISADVYGTKAHIHMLYVPKHMRGQGVGRKTYEEWEARLPATIERVELEAVDYGDGAGDAHGFWASLGFIDKYEGRNLTDEAQDAMWKGVNGHEVETIDLDSDPDNIIDQITACLGDVHGYQLAGAWLFGSRANGTARDDSDFDVLVVLDKGDPERAQEYLHSIIGDYTYAVVDFTVTTKAALKDTSTVAYKAFTTGHRLF